MGSKARASRQVTRHYAIAVSILGGLILAGAVLTAIIERQQSDLLALSQKNAEQRLTFAKASSQAQAVMRQATGEAPNLDVVARIQADLLATTEKLRTNHEDIHVLAAQVSTVTSSGPSLMSYFEEPPFKLNERFRVFLERVDNLASTDPATLPQRFRLWSALDIATAPNSVLVRGFDQVFAAMHERALAAADQTRTISLLLKLSILAVLALEVLLIFQPLVRRLRREENEAAASNARLVHLAHYDELTGLANRRRLQELAAALGDAPEGAGATLFLLEIDGLKSINDSMGHRVGDEVVKIVAERLLKYGGDGSAARLVGGEFALLAPHAHSDEAAHGFAVSLAAALAEEIVIDGHRLRIRAPIGFATYPDHETDPNHLLASADIALDDAKTRPRDKKVVGFTIGARDQVMRDQIMEAELHEALRSGQIVPFFQPQVTIGEEKHIGFEMLARWRHPMQGVLAPGAWLRIAEERGMMTQLTRVLSREVVRRVEAWRAEGLTPGHIAINVPEPMLAAPNGLDELLETAAELEALGSALEIEVTENVFVERDADTIRENLEAARQRGVRIALDDFGTGYASLRHLQEIPFDILKIDQTFVRNIETRFSCTLIEMLARLSGELDVVTVAEGVETQAQLDALREIGCAIGQGYLFDRPMAPEDVPGYLRAAAEVGSTQGPALLRA